MTALWIALAAVYWLVGFGYWYGRKYRVETPYEHASHRGINYLTLLIGCMIASPLSLLWWICGFGVWLGRYLPWPE